MALKNIVHKLSKKTYQTRFKQTLISAVSSRNFVPFERYGRPNKCPQITQTKKKVVVECTFYSLSPVRWASSVRAASNSSYFTKNKHGVDFFVSAKDLSIQPHAWTYNKQHYESKRDILMVTRSLENYQLFNKNWGRVCVFYWCFWSYNCCAQSSRRG